MEKIVYAGDSTAAFNHIDTYPQTGMSQGLALYLKEGAGIQSFAVNGRSTKSFIEQGRLELVARALEPGDILLVQFGHNDEKDDPLRHTDAETTYQDNLLKFVETARSHKAFPVLITPIARRNFDENGVFVPGSHGAYPAAVKQVGKDAGVPVIDLTAVTEAFLAGMGELASRNLYMWPKDNTHLKAEGAVIMAGFLGAGLKALGAPYSNLLAEAESKEHSGGGL